MERRYKYIFQIAVFIMVILGSTVSRGETLTEQELQRETLKGLPGVEVVIYDISDGLKKRGITEELIKNDVEVRLRKAGIKVFMSNSDRKFLTSGRPQLIVSMFYYKSESCSAVDMNLGLSQDATLHRNSFFGARTETWEYGFLGINLGTRPIKNATGDVVDQFINDYLAANPKK